MTPAGPKTSGERPVSASRSVGGQASRLQSLARAALLIHDSRLSLDEMRGLVTEQARLIIGAHQGRTSLTDDDHSDAGADRSNLQAEVGRTNKPMRLIPAEFARRAGQDAPGVGWMAAPLVGRDGGNLGFIELSHPTDGQFSADDEAILVQLAQMASAAIENARLYRETRERETALLHQGHLTRTITDNAADALFMMDERGHPTFMNPAAETITGYRLEELRGRSLHSVLHHTRPDGSPYPIEECPIGRSLLTKQSVESYEDLFLRSDGTFFPVLVSASPILRDGVHVGTVVDFRDITELRFQRSILEAQSEASSDGLLLVSPEGRMLSHNRRFAEMWGFSEELMATGLDDAALEAAAERVVDPEGFIARVRYLYAHRDDRSIDEVRFRDGRLLERNGAPVYSSDGVYHGHLWSFRDRTEERRAEQALRESDERLRLALEAAELGDWELDVGSMRAERSARHDQIFGYSEKLPEWSYPIFLEHVHPDDRDEVDRRLQRTLATGEAWEFECRIRRSDATVRWIWAKGRMFDDDAGQPTRLLGTVMDITDRKAAEEALRESNRQKDQFLAVLAHELRNPLVPILNAAELFGRVVPDDPKVARAAELVQRQVRHLSRLTDDLLEVSRLTQGRIVLRRVPTELGALLLTTTDDRREVLEEHGVMLETSLATKPLWVLGDPTRLSQVVDNLLVNSEKFTPAGGRIEVVLRVDPSDSDAALIEVRDTGIGMEKGLIDRLFQPFSQAAGDLAHSHGGLGLGLALVKGLVALHEGSVIAQSAGPGRGSTFRISLPLVGPPGPSGPAASETPQPARPRRVLIVEDNPDVAEVLKLALESFGHRVLVAHTGSEGVRCAREFEPHIVLCDIGLPGELDGYSVARAIRADPDLADMFLVALTGYGQDRDRERTLDAGFDLHLTKPVSIDRLEELIAGQAELAQD